MQQFAFSSKFTACIIVDLCIAKHNYRQIASAQVFFVPIFLCESIMHCIPCSSGVTWAVGLLGKAFPGPLVAVAFVALNSLQGLLIFVFSVLMSQRCRARLNRELSTRSVGRRLWDGADGYCFCSKTNSSIWRLMFAQSTNAENQTNRKRRKCPSLFSRGVDGANADVCIKSIFFPANPCRGLPTTLAGLRGSPRGSSGNAGLGGGGGGGMRSTKESTAKGDTTGHGKIRYGIRT